MASSSKFNHKAPNHASPDLPLLPNRVAPPGPTSFVQRKRIILDSEGREEKGKGKKWQRGKSSNAERIRGGDEEGGGEEQEVEMGHRKKAISAALCSCCLK